jgi:exopolysaccharide biosynthesis WecB/TagA/CpsF family protein
MAARHTIAASAARDFGPSPAEGLPLESDSRPRPEHREFLGLPFCLSTLEEAVRLILDTCAGPYAYVVTPNAHHVVTVHKQPDTLLPIYRNAWLSVCDSQIVRALAACDRLPLPIVRGSDLVAALLAEQNAGSTQDDRKRFLIVGPDVATRRLLRTRYPRVHVEVLPAPHGLAQRADLRHQVAQICVRRPWDILLLCVGCPAQEKIAALIAEQGRTSGIAVCAGASVDFLTGRQPRAPRWLQKVGLEWVYRLGREPRRLWRRYLVESPGVARIYLNARRASHR